MLKVVCVNSDGSKGQRKSKIEWHSLKGKKKNRKKSENWLTGKEK